MGEEELDSGLPNFRVPSEGVAFPEGYYVAVMGGVQPVYPKDQEVAKNTPPEAILHTMWILKYQGTEDNPQDDKRITLKDGKVNMGSIRGVKLIERYPNPTLKPKMAWRMKAFFDNFPDVMEEVSTGRTDPNGKPVVERYVNWNKVKLLYGRVVRIKLVYVKDRTDPNKSYRNIAYDDVEVFENVVPADDMKKIEGMFHALKSAEEQEKENPTAPPPDADDLPF